MASQTSNELGQWGKGLISGSKSSSRAVKLFEMVEFCLDGSVVLRLLPGLSPKIELPELHRG